MQKNDRAERRKKLVKLLAMLPGKRVEQIRATADILCVSEYTVRAWLCSSLTRVPTMASLTILEREISRQYGN